MLLSYQEVHELNKNVLTLAECEILHKSGYDVVCRNGSIKAIVNIYLDFKNMLQEMRG